MDDEVIARQRENDDLSDSINTRDAVAIGLAITGGVLIGTGLVLFLTDGGETAEVTAGPGSLHFSGRF